MAGAHQNDEASSNSWSAASVEPTSEDVHMQDVTVAGTQQEPLFVSDDQEIPTAAPIAVNLGQSVLKKRSADQMDQVLKHKEQAALLATLLPNLQAQGFYQDLPEEIKEEPVDELPVHLGDIPDEPSAGGLWESSESESDTVPKRRPRARRPAQKRAKCAERSSLDISKIVTPSLTTIMKKVANVPKLPTFGQSTSKKKAFDALKAKAPEGEAATYNAHTKLLDSACSDLGVPLIKPADEGHWTVPGMISTLQHHQLLGLRYAVMMERRTEKPYGGIIADQMGLGKTVMALALIVRGKFHTRSPAQNPEHTMEAPNTTLVVCPAGIVTQWSAEIGVHTHKELLPASKKSRQGIVRYKIYRGKAEEHQGNALEELAGFDVLITTYDEVLRSFPLQDPPAEIIDPDEREIWWSDHYKEKKGLLHRLNFKRIILDEAHLIRNPESKKSRACYALSSQFRWCMTGTPLFNGVKDYWSLFNFIQQPMDENYEGFIRRFVKKKDENSDAALHEILDICRIQRTHENTLFNSRIVHLPPSHQQVVRTNFNPVEREIYNIVEERFIERINHMSKHGEFMRRNNHVWAMITCLRQLTAHPLLIQKTYLELLERDDLKRLDRVFREYTASNKQHGKALIQLIRNVLEQQADAGGGKTKQILRVEAIEEANEDELIAEANSKNSTGRRYGINFKFQRYLDKLNEQHRKVELAAVMICSYCIKMAESPVITSCLHIYCETCMKEAQEDAAHDGKDGAACDATDCGQVFSSVEPADDYSRMIALDQHHKKRGKKSKLPDGITDWLKDSGDLVPSAKTMAIKAQILSWLEEAPNDKIIIFTQWRGLITILDNMCKIEKWGCCVLTGTMQINARDEAIRNFEKTPSCKILISGLRVGGTGLNLTMANRCIIVDIWWNNAVEDQAVARTYRIGQTKTTAFLQLVSNDTIDERIEQVKQRKQKEIDAFIKVRPSQREIMGLFGKVVEDSEGNMRISDAETGEEESTVVDDRSDDG